MRLTEHPEARRSGDLKHRIKDKLLAVGRRPTISSASNKFDSESGPGSYRWPARIPVSGFLRCTKLISHLERCDSIHVRAERIVLRRYHEQTESCRTWTVRCAPAL